MVAALGASALAMTACTNADTTRSSVAEAAAQTESPSPTSSATDTQSASPSGSASPSASMNTDRTERKDLVSATKVTWDKAADTAVKEVPEGKLVDLELKRVDATATASPTGSPSPSMPNPAPSQGAPEWEAKVAQTDGTLHWVHVDAVSGKVFRTQVDPDQDADGKTEVADRLKQAKQTPQQAVKAAMNEAQGTVTHVELGDNDQQQVVWAVDVVSKDNWNKTTVDVDAANGKVLTENVDND